MAHKMEVWLSGVSDVSGYVAAVRTDVSQEQDRADKWNELHLPILQLCNDPSNARYLRGLACAILNRDLADTGLLWSHNDNGLIASEYVKEGSIRETIATPMN